jgi:diguanylate cyclase (GGDEF)-like protein
MCIKRKSMKLSISISFIMLILTTSSLIGYFLFSSWKVSIENMVSKMQNHTNEDILEQVEKFISNPMHINEANYNVIQNEIVNLQDKEKREKFFAGVIKTNKDEIYSFTYGTENREYYGARINKKNEIEIIENNSKTNGKSRYYSIKNDLTSGELVEETNKFDPRTRDWYIVAKQKQKQAFSPIYKHFVMDDLAISAAYPIYNDKGILQGVLGTHVTLSKINKYLEEVGKDYSAIAYIVEKDSGELIANSLEKPNFESLEDNKIKRIKINEIENKYLADVYQNYKVKGSNKFVVKSENDKLHITVTECKEGGLNWLIITAIPESQFTSGLIKGIQISILLSIFAIIIAILIYIKNTSVVLKPIYNLINTTEKFSKGDFSQRAEIYRDDEIGKLSSAFNKMAQQLYGLINNLEEKVKERTTELEKTNEEVIYLSYHDQLTGLYNRRYFEEELIRLDVEKNLPLTIVMADMNGLKLINDSLGHSMGDRLIKKVSEVITKGCRKDDIVARLGGDEFVILLPKTDSNETKKIIKRIENIALEEKVGSVNISISFGYESKTSIEEKIEEVLKKAEDCMYKKKLFDSPNMKGKTINLIISNLQEKNKREEEHYRRVSELCKSIGEALDLSDIDIEELKTFGLLHDIGKIAIDNNTLDKHGKLTNEEWEEIKRHPEIGYRILSTVNETSEIAEYVLAHHERWDGSGYPKGLRGTEIPFQSRIIAIADAYDAMTSERNYRNALSKEEVIEELQKNSGTQFDPELVRIFIEKVL